MLRHATAVLLAIALVAMPAAAFATDHASASENQGRMGAHDAMPADTAAPKPIKKKLHRPTTRKTSAQPVKKKAAAIKTKRRSATSAKKAAPAPTSGTAPESN